MRGLQSFFMRNRVTVFAFASLLLAPQCDFNRVAAKETLILPYNAMRDKASIADIFERDRYWLSATPGYAIGTALDYQSPDASLRKSGLLTTKVLREKEVFAGFVSYYISAPGEGKILFLSVEPKFRGRQFGKLLLEGAVKELQQEGVKTVSLTTRVENYRAQRVYHQVGFKETGRDDIYVYFRYVAG